MCPDVTGENGLANIFMSMVDKQYAKDVTEEIGPVRNFKSITQFIDAFCKHVQKHYEWANTSVAIPYRRHGYMLKTAEQPKHATDKEKTYVEASRKYDRLKHADGEAKKSYASDHRNDWRAKKPSGYSQHRVAYVNECDRNDELVELHASAPTSDPHVHRDGFGTALKRGDRSYSDDDVDEWRSVESEDDPDTEDQVLLEADIPPDRSEMTRGLYMVGNDGETRPRGCMYYAIFGNCLKGTKCNNADGHTPEGKRRTAAWLLAKLTDSPNQATQGPVKIMTRDRPGGK